MQTHGTWGEREVVYGDSSSLTTVLFLKKNKRCSWHKHKTAFNRFYVISGKLGVKTDNGLTIIGPKQSFEVAPGIMHEFQTFELDTVIVEVAYVSYDPSDIHREKLGGENERQGA